MPGCILQSGAFCFSKSFFEKVFFFGWHIHGFAVEGCRKGINTKRALRNELIDACRERKRRQLREVIFSDLTPQEERQLYTVDKYFQDGNEEAFCAGGLKITAKLLAEALHTLPDEKRQAVLLYYFFNMTDVEIAEAMKIPRSTVQYRRTSSFELLKRYLEERADEWND